MKFEYDEDNPRGKPVAYIKDIDGDIYFTFRDKYGDCIRLSKYGIHLHAAWDPKDAAKLFYEGDKVTITL